MRNRSKSHLTRADAESLLDGGTAGAPRLEQLLAAASAPIVNEVGEEIAVASFHQAGVSPSTPRRRLTSMKSALAALVTSKVLVGTAVAAAATGGIALAASQAGQSRGPENDTVPGNHASASATPSPNLSGLCVAFRAGATDNKGKAADSPAFQALVTAAGSAEEVDAYCTTLLGSSPEASDTPGGKPSDLPSQASGHPSGKPSSLPTESTDHPSGKPSSLPTESTDHPTGGPSGAGSERP